MPTKRTNKNKQRSQPVRKNLSGRSQSKGGVHSKRIQRRGRGQQSNVGTNGNDFTGLLAKPLRSKSVFEVNNSFHEGLVPELYKCLKQMDGFKDDKEWLSQPSLSELCEYLISEIKRLTPEEFVWNVIVNYNDEINILYTKEYSQLEDYTAVPLQWLPKLKERNYYLHQLTIALIYKVSVQCAMELFMTKWDDYVMEDHEQFIQAGEDNEPGEGEVRAVDLIPYQTTIKELKEEMKRLDGFYTDKNLANRIKTFNPTTPMERHLKRWLKLGIELMKEAVPISRFIPPLDEEESRDCEPLTPEDGLNFTWSFYDTVSEQVEEWRNDFYQNGGIVYPTELITYTPKKKVESLPISKYMMLVEFMKEGRAFYFTHFDKQIKKFYDIRREQQSI